MLKISAELQNRLPVTFAAYCMEQLRGWDLLFPAEQTYYERLFGLLERSDPAEVERLFRPLRDAEARMGVTPRTWPAGEFTLDQVDFLNRNPRYPEWRAAVSNLFAHIDPILDAEAARKGHSRLVVVIAPSDLPVGPDRMWTRIEKHGQRIRLDPPEDPAAFIPTLLPSIPALAAGKPYDAWVVESGAGLPAGPACVHLSYAQLEPYRKRLMSEVNQLVQSEDVRGPRQLSARLKQLKILPSEAALSSDAILAEFVRATLLSGNGTLLINNTFVEWATVQAVRRAKPSVVVAAFGVRNKVKPFSSLLIYADQDKVNPIPTQMDTLGSYVDLEIFYQYIWQEFEKYGEYRKNTAYLFIGEAMDQMLAIAPPDFPLKASSDAVPLAKVYQAMRDWMMI